jgi:putative transposase
LMPNRLLLWPRDDGELSEVMRWNHGNAYATLVCTPSFVGWRAGLVGRAEYWQWSSLWRLSRENEKSSEILSQWPMERPKDWNQFVNEPERESELEDMWSSAQRGRPYGSEDWMIKIAKQLGLGSTMNPRGRPKRS